ncbi:MAG: hypothetical protein AAF902_01520 [Chloroflexota bacterium]
MTDNTPETKPKPVDSKNKSFIWGAKQMLGLAPDVMTVRGMARMLEPERWTQLAHSGDFVWGLYKRPKMGPHTIAFKKSDLTATCTCSATKQPCKFILALYVLYADQPQLFSISAEPDWIQHQFDQQPARQIKGANLDQVQAGMAEFGRWLRDQIQYGVSNFPDRVSSDVEAMANRLIDAHLPLLADSLRDLGRLVAPKKGNPPENWPEIVVTCFGQFYLQTQAWEKFDLLSTVEQQDLIHAFVSPQIRFAMVAPITSDPVAEWQIIGRRFETVGRGLARRTWALDLVSNRFLMLEDSASGRNRTIPQFVTNGAYTHDQLFAPSIMNSGRLFNPLIDGGSVADFQTIEHHFIQVRTQNPWQRFYPVVLRQVQLHFDEPKRKWLLTDRQGNTVTMTNGGDLGWYLLASSKGEATDLFAEWTVNGLTLLSIFTGDQWLDLNVWGSKT